MVDLFFEFVDTSLTSFVEGQRTLTSSESSAEVPSQHPFMTFRHPAPCSATPSPPLTAGDLGSSQAAADLQVTQSQ